MEKLPTPEEFLAYTKGVTDLIDNMSPGQDREMSRKVCKAFNRINGDPKIVTRIMSAFLLYCYRKKMTIAEAAEELIIMSGAQREVH